MACTYQHSPTVACKSIVERHHPVAGKVYGRRPWQQCSLFEVLSWEVPECARMARRSGTVIMRQEAFSGGAPDRALGRYRTKRICNNYNTYALVCNRRPSRKSEVNGNYEFMPGKHENRHFSTIAGHYQHTQNPEIFIAFQDCGTNHQRPSGTSG